MWQEAPRCRLFGRFALRGAPGPNALRLPRRIGGHRLVAGTYRLIGRVARRDVLDLRVRVQRVNGRLHVRKTHVAGGCIAGTEALSVFATPALLAGNGGNGFVRSATPSASRPTSGTRGASRTSGQAFRPPGLSRLPAAVRHTLLFVLLALAIALLTASSIPESALRGTPAAVALARHRAALTSAGLAMLLAAALAALLA